MAVMFQVDEICRSLDGPEPPPCYPAQDDGPPPGLTNSRADLVTWWRWRYAALKAKNASLADLLVQALGEGQGYRAVLQAALDALRKQARRHDCLHEQHRRLRDEYRSYRERVRPTEQRAGRRAAA